MMEEKDFNRVSVLVVGAGPSGLACAMGLKKRRPELEICVIDKAHGPGNHNLSGAVLETTQIKSLLDAVGPQDWADTEQARDILSRTVDNDRILFLPNSRLGVDVSFAVRIAGKLGKELMKVVSTLYFPISSSQMRFSRFARA